MRSERPFVTQNANRTIAECSDESTIAVFDEAVDVLVAAGAEVKRVHVPLYDELATGAFLALQAEPR